MRLSKWNDPAILYRRTAGAAELGSNANATECARRICGGSRDRKKWEVKLWSEIGAVVRVVRENWGGKKGGKQIP